MLWRALAFLVLAAASAGAMVDGWFADAVAPELRRVVAHGASASLGVVGVDAQVESASDSGKIFVRMPKGSVEIVDSCTGADAMALLVAAVLVFPSPWRAKGLGIAVAVGVAAIANWLRVLVLCAFVGARSPWFGVAHEYVWPALIVVVCLSTQLGWFSHVARARAASLRA